ncbi:tetratricopeptide repeat protein [Frankia sp. AiPa1]|uniref:tetratricopeptide repeat protein n=1 Tax=Frankia sp. AiPa1 TaxID=573492 RepID=UPI0035A8B7C9
MASVRYPAPASPRGRSTGSRAGIGTATGIGSGDRGHPGTAAAAGAMAGAARAHAALAESWPRTDGPLGAGLVRVPPVVQPDPANLLLADPRLPLRLRMCRRCGEPVGRPRAGQPALAEGFCAGCGQPYSLRPGLRPGDQIGPYEIEGVLAHGAHGWTYLARVHTGGTDTWVAMRALTASADRAVRAAAMAERRFLTELDHPGIARAHTCLEHGDTCYLVTEHVAGITLREMQRQRHSDAGRPDPLPVTEAIAFVLAILPALGYLHRRGLVYGDLRPDTIMAGGDQIRLVELRGVHRARGGPGEPSVVPALAQGTVGFQAPEAATEGPSAAGDLYAAARTLAALALDVRGLTSTYRFSLPPAAGHGVLARHESLSRLLTKATARDPSRRFRDAKDLHDELLGVLHEVVAAEHGRPAPARSTRFSPESTGTTTGTTTAAPAPAPRSGPPGSGPPTGGWPAGGWPVFPWSALPRLLPDPADPACDALRALPEIEPARVTALLAALATSSPAARLHLADLHTRRGDRDAARALLAAAEAASPHDWRVRWQRGLLLLAEGDATSASTAFDRVYSEVPGELAPKLALAVAAESAGDHGRARMLYDLVSRTDNTLSAAAFGLARLRLAAGDRTGALEAYRRVPPDVVDHAWARIHFVRALGTVGDRTGAPDLAGLRSASTVLAELDLPPTTRAALTRELLTGALALLRSGAQAPDPGTEIAGTPLSPVPVRLGLEHAYRTLASHASTSHERHRLVDLANRIRPRTLL